MTDFSNNSIQRSESFSVGALLTFAGGFLDAYTYVLRDGVFANAQTGNMVLLGLRFAEGRWQEGLHYLIPIFAFALGVLLALAIRKRYQHHPAFHWRQLVLVVECIVLFTIGFIPSGDWNPYVNIAISFVCALQVESFRTVHGLSCATTMCTGNLRSGTELLFHYFTTKSRISLQGAVKYYGIILVFIIGAVVGFLASKAIGIISIWIPCAMFLFVFFMLMKKPDDKNKSNQISEGVE